jgi:two-component system LytT family response regulator
MIKVFIVDDERLARQELKKLLGAFDDIEIIGDEGDPTLAIEQIENLKPDLLFLDIQMPGKNGFRLLEELDYVPFVIFVTAYDEYAIKAFQVNAFDYLLKPVEDSRLTESIHKIREEIRSQKSLQTNNEKLGEGDQVFVKDGEKCWFVNLSDVRFFESEGNYIRIFFKEFKPLILKSLNNLEKRLDTKVFFRANRKHIINLKWIEKIEPWFNGGLLVSVKGGDKIEISRRQAVKLKEMMSL